jgi:hypothetical protein
MQDQYLSLHLISNFRAGITEGEAQDKFQEAREQYRSAKHEMESLETLEAVTWKVLKSWF